MKNAAPYAARPNFKTTSNKIWWRGLTGIFEYRQKAQPMNTSPKVIYLLAIVAVSLFIVVSNFVTHETSKPCLSWDNSTACVHATFNQTEAKSTFRFTNVSGTPIDITSVKASCGCVSYRMDKLHYMPSEMGIIELKSDITDQIGTSSSTTLVTVLPSKDVITLTSVVVVPSAISTSPTFLEWEVGEAPTSKSFDIEVKNTSVVSITGVSVSRKDIDVRLKPIEDQRR